MTNKNILEDINFNLSDFALFLSVMKNKKAYQGLIDSPVLKAGFKTKYKQLPATVIIFITRDDIFKRDLAKYTFVEKCKEIEDLELEDGTTKIFLNMTSKNGSKELVSMLQYMKDTRLDNPELLVKDKRIVELDEIVNEVKESEEWEGIKMNILDIGIQEGERRGKEEGVISMIKACKDLNIIKDQVLEQLVDKFLITKEDAEKYMEMYW